MKVRVGDKFEATPMLLGLHGEVNPFSYLVKQVLDDKLIIIEHDPSGQQFTEETQTMLDVVNQGYYKFVPGSRKKIMPRNFKGKQRGGNVA